jgi:starch synthase
MPLYEDIPESYRKEFKFLTFFTVPLGWRSQYCGVYEFTHMGVKHYFLDNEYYFKRHNIYGFFDDAERFAFFSKAVLEAIQHIDFKPEIIHCNDWQTGLIPTYLNVFYRQLELYRDIKTIFTIHNVKYQGTFALETRYDVVGLPAIAGSIIEFAEDANFMKGAIEQCDALTTVSPTYAQELMDPWFAHGLDGMIRNHAGKLSGILNGIDMVAYNPETDSKLVKNFSAADKVNRDENKRELQDRLGLEKREEAMLIGIVTRLDGLKGMDLFLEALERIMNMDVQVAVLGTGDCQYEMRFREIPRLYPGRVSVTVAFDSNLAHRIYAGSDVFLMPSKSEPCGLAQMIALRYGSIPIVRSTGGLKDTINDFGGDFGNGYNFLTYNPNDMLDAIARADADFRDKEKWARHMDLAMGCDFSWGRSAGEYIKLYKGLIAATAAV